jgi:hypothetical protein
MIDYNSKLNCRVKVMDFSSRFEIFHYDQYEELLRMSKKHNGCLYMIIPFSFFRKYGKQMCPKQEDTHQTGARVGCENSSEEKSCAPCHEPSSNLLVMQCKLPPQAHSKYEYTYTMCYCLDNLPSHDK